MRFFFAIFCLIAILGCWLRIEGSFSKSFAFTYDVGRDLLAVKDIVELGKFPLIGQTTGLPGLFYGPWWYYILTPVFILSQGNPAGIAFFMGLSGTATVLLGFKIGKDMGGKYLGLIFASFLSFSPAMVSISTQIWNPNLIPLFVILLMYCLHFIFVSNEGNKKLNSIYFLFVGLLIGLILDSEIVFGLLFSIGAIFSIVIFLRNRIKLIHYSFLISGFFVILFPRIVFELRHNFLMTNSLLRFAGKFFSFGQNSHDLFMPIHSIATLYRLWLETISRGNWFVGIVLMILAISSLIFLYKKLKKEEKFFLNFCLVIIAAFFIGLSFFTGDIWGHYVVGIPALYIFIVSLAFYKAMQNLKRIKFFVIFMLTFIILFNLNPLQIVKSFQEPLWEGDASYYRNQQVVVDYVYGQANGKEFNYVVYTPPIHDYTYKYIFSWYGKKHYGYVPKKEKASLFFLILEPDYQYPFRLTSWLKDRKNDGKIIKEETEKGKIIVQTRIH